MGYATPADVGISDNRAAHVARNSAEPGTDYKTAYGTDLRMAEDGVVIVADNSPYGADGRRLSILIDDNGEVIDYIHLENINVKVGTRVKRAQKGVCTSGASGFGQNRYYGPHVHVTRRARRGLPFHDTLDFEDAVGGSSKPAPAPATNDDHTPPNGEYNPFGIKWSVGLQKVANLYLPHGGFSDTALDAKFGPTSMHGFAQFLRRNWGYVGNDVLGPVMWAAIARWLRARYEYVGNDVPGPIMRSALYRAENKNYREL